MFSKSEHCNKVLALWAPIREKLYWIIVSIVNDRLTAEDVLQEALIIAIEKFQTLRDESKFEPWFVTIAIRKAYEFLADNRNTIDLQNIDEGAVFDTFSDQISPDIQYNELVVLILKSFKSESKRYLFYLRFVEDRPLKEIIQITGLKEGTLKSTYSRMKKELCEMLGKEFSIDD